ncbi:MAG: SRPBCC family protein [Haloarculaceae archaeon]
MQTVSLDRWIDAEPAPVQAAMEDLGRFMRAAGFDEVTVDGDSIHIENSVGIFAIELDLDLLEDGDLAYEQRDGIFREMTTVYDLAAEEGGTRVTATTDFELAAAFAGPVLDATVVKRQRKRELRGQFDYLEARAE